jgi:hypothetical protein
MRGNCRYSVLPVLTLGVASVFASADPGYLPVVGPAALRFRAASMATANLPISARPEITEPESVLIRPETLDPLNAVTNEVSAAAERPEPVLPHNPIPAEPVPSGEVISPQMLLKYFTKSTNGTGAGVLGPMPLNFTPPPPSQTPSSKATYSTSP